MAHEWFSVVVLSRADGYPFGSEHGGKAYSSAARYGWSVLGTALAAALPAVLAVVAWRRRSLWLLVAVYLVTLAGYLAWASAGME